MCKGRGTRSRSLIADVNSATCTTSSGEQSVHITCHAPAQWNQGAQMAYLAGTSRETLACWTGRENRQPGTRIAVLPAKWARSKQQHWWHGSSKSGRAELKSKYLSLNIILPQWTAGMFVVVELGSRRSYATLNIYVRFVWMLQASVFMCTFPAFTQFIFCWLLIA